MENTIHTHNVVTYMTDQNRGYLDVCSNCEARFAASGTWPKDRRGVEYCTVHHGSHRGECGVDAHERRMARA